MAVIKFENGTLLDYIYGLGVAIGAPYLIVKLIA